MYSGPHLPFVERGPGVPVEVAAGRGDSDGGTETVEVLDRGVSRSDEVLEAAGEGNGAKDGDAETEGEVSGVGAGAAVASLHASP